MKKLSIKLKITVWFAVSMLIIIGITLSSVVGISHSVIKKETFAALQEVVEENADEIEYIPEYNKLDIDDDYDIYLEYKSGYLEIDDDFVRSVNGIKCSVYDENGNILYGDNILYKVSSAASFSGDAVRTAESDGEKYYYFDKKLPLKNNETLWLRGVVDARYGNSSFNTIITLSLWIIPFLVIISLLGGYLVSKRSLAPIDKICESAQSIREGNDLSKRINVFDSSYEVHSLSESFNGMLDGLERSFKSEQQLTNDVSHELRTPVSVIMSQCEFTLEKERTVPEYEEAMELILRQSRRMSSMINDMLSFARLERTVKRDDFTDIDLSDVVSGVCTDMALIREKNITLHTDVEAGIIINGDTGLISRLCVNLISNAYRYGKEDGNIYVTLKTQENEAVLSVIDDGVGISEDDIDKIWNRFYRADKSRSKKGTGLGLNFVSEITRLHGGITGVSSEIGKGSIFTVKIPKKL